MGKLNKIKHLGALDRVAITNSHTLGGLNNKKIISHSLKAEKSEIRLPTQRGSGESPLPGLQMAVSLLSPHRTESREKGSKFSFLFFVKATDSNSMT